MSQDNGNDAVSVNDVVSVTDQDALDYVRQLIENLPEGGYKKRHGRTIISRFAEVLEDRKQARRQADVVHDAIKMVVSQAQLAMGQTNRLSRALEEVAGNLRTALPAPAPASAPTAQEPSVDLKGS